MQRISTSSAVADLFGGGKAGFRNGDLPRGVLPTAFNAEWCNHVQEEICNVIEGAGVALNPDKRDQLLAAMKKLIDEQAGTVKTSGNQTVGGEKTFTSTAFFKGGAFVSDSVADFNANQCLQLGANNVNTYFYNKRSGKYLSMRNDGELRYDGKRLLNTDDLAHMMPSGDKAANGWCRLPNGLIDQWGEVLMGWQREGPVKVVFPIAFTSECFNVQITVKSSGRSGMVVTDLTIGAGEITATGFSAMLNTWAQGAGANDFQGFAWRAIGK